MEIEEESKSNRSKVAVAMNSLRTMIDEQEDVLMNRIQQEEDHQKEPIEEFKRNLQDEQHKLVQQILDFVIIGPEKQKVKRMTAKQKFDEYMRITNVKLQELRPRTRKKFHILDLEAKVEDIKNKIRSVHLVEKQRYDNPPLRERIKNIPDKTTYNLANSNLTDLDMEIVAQELETNRVKTQYIFRERNKMKTNMLDMKYFL